MSVWDHVQLVEDSGTQFFLLFPDCFSIFNVFIAVHGELYTPVSCTRWTSYTGVSLFPNCVPNLKNIYLSCLARTLDNFLAKAVKFSSVLSVFGSKVFLHTICMAAIFLHICDWAGVWVSPIHLFLLTNFQRYFELVIFLLIAAEEPLPPLIEPCFNSLLTRYFTSYLPYMSRS